VITEDDPFAEPVTGPRSRWKVLGCRFATLRFHLTAYDQVVVVDEATRTTVNLVDPGFPFVRMADP
jgi:hypothetical protein